MMNGGGDKEFVEERVAYTLDKSHARRYNARISVSRTIDRVGRAKVDKTFRQFTAEDVGRVLDYDNVEDPPPDGPMMHGEGPIESITFPKRHFCLRGGFLFYFDLSNVSGTGHSHYVTYHGPPKGVIPIHEVTIEFPPGGRRVFREHAQTDARTGYEFAILHNPPEEKRDTARPPAFVAAESLGQRDKWANAIRERAPVDSHTPLRAIAFGSDAHYSSTKPAELLKEKTKNQKKQKDLQHKESSHSMGGAGGAGGSSGAGAGGTAEKRNRKSKRSSVAKGGKSDDGDREEEIIQEALQEFGKNNFSEKTWIDNYFESHNDVDAQGRCRKMENWQQSLKKGLKNAVLEQYEYFVEASAEMTKMGREVVDLKNLVETQVGTIKEMKEIDFSNVVDHMRGGGDVDDNASDLGDDMFNDTNNNNNNNLKEREGKRNKKGMRRGASGGALLSGDDASDASSVSSFGGAEDKVNGAAPRFRDPDSQLGHIEIAGFLEDAAEEIIAYVKESRYSDATDLWSKAKSEMADVMNLHESPTDHLLTRKQVSQMQMLEERMEEVAEMISKRLVENLRRKNEALKQASKRERSDPSAHTVPSVSPTCLDDDSISLRLLVKLGKTQEAAIAYSARRSLLLLESLHERPLSSTGNVDLVIYAAQLSQSFFSCLAGAIEGFLDLFLAAAAEKVKDEASLDESSIHSSMNNIPAGALASIVLWCDSELSKFSAAFGGTRVLGNLALTPPPQDGARKKGPRVVGQDSESSIVNKDRQTAIEVAAQCVGQAFQYASENLDTVGLPLTPRLAESLRKRLKGCEAEVASLLDDQWRPVVLEWEIAMDDDELAIG